MKLYLKILLKLIFKTKFQLSPPQQKKILIYDVSSNKFAKFLFKKKHCETFYNRFERINLFVLKKAIINNGFKDLSFNYRKIYFSIVKPKIIFTSIDTNPGFYILKNKLKKYIFLSVQNGLRDDKYYNIFIEIRENLRKKILSDYIFTLGNNDKTFIEKIFDSKIIPTGNIINNHFPVHKRKIKKNIIFIQQAKLPLPKNYSSNNIKNKSNIGIDKVDQKVLYDTEIKLIKFAHKYCLKNKLNFKVFIKRDFTRKIILESTGIKKINFISLSKNFKLGYKTLDSALVSITMFSSLGYENLSRGNKTIFILPKIVFDLKNNRYLPKNKESEKKTQIFFEDINFDYKKFSETLKKISKISNLNWKKKVKEVSDDFMIYNKNNNIIKNIINKISN